MVMQVAQHSLDLRKVVKSLKGLNSKDFSLQSESYMNSLPLSSQEKLAVGRVFSARTTGNKADENIKMTIWM